MKLDQLRLKKLYLPQNCEISIINLLRYRKDCKNNSKYYNKLYTNYNFRSKNFKKKFIKKNNTKVFATKMWQRHLSKLNFLYFNDLYNLLNDDLSRYAFYLTTGNAFLKSQITYLEKNINFKLRKNLLTEIPAFNHTITNLKYLTSESRVNNLTHLISCQNTLKIKIKNLDYIGELGGGVGIMADIVKMINKKVTYVIFDFPIVLLIQSHYLSCKYLYDDINFVSQDNLKIKKGKINLCPVNLMEEAKLGNKVDLFISFWALSEANELTHKKINKLKFFDAQNIFYGYRKRNLIDPRQPCSKKLDLANYKYEENDECCFWTFNNENFYQTAKKM